jgi:hypothetical protein
MDKAGARYDFVKSVDPEQNVAEFIARWMAQAKLDVDPSLVTLRLVPCGARTPTAEEEQAAAELDPRVTLADAGFTDGSSLLAVVAGALDVARAPFRLQATRAHATAAGARPLQRQPFRLQHLTQKGVRCRRWRPRRRS